VTPAEITKLESKYLSKTNECITYEGLTCCAAKLLPEGSLLVTTRATIGGVAVSKLPVCTNQGFKNIVPNEMSNVDFYYHLFSVIVPELSRLASGSTFPEINQRNFEAIIVPMPSKEEQRHIAEILDTIDEAIQKTEALISKLKAMKQGLLHDLLTRGLDKNGKLRDPKAHLMLGRIPRHWDVRPLGVTATLQRGFDLPIQDRMAGDVPIFGSNGIDGRHNESRVSGPGVITGRSGSIGFVYYTDTNFWPLNTTLYVKEFHGNRPKFIRLLLESLRLDRFTAATGVPSLNRNFVHPIEVTVPEPAEQDCIVDVVEAHDARIRTEEQYSDKLKLQKKGLMHDLLTGKVRVKV
jgi:type I restriction enzyme S subunit